MRRALETRIDLGEQRRPVYNEEVDAKGPQEAEPTHPVAYPHDRTLDLIDHVATKDSDRAEVVPAKAERPVRELGLTDELDRGRVHGHAVMPSDRPTFRRDTSFEEGGRHAHERLVFLGPKRLELGPVVRTRVSPTPPVVRLRRNMTEPWSKSGSVSIWSSSAT